MSYLFANFISKTTFTYKRFPMYFLIKDKDELYAVPVSPEREPAFRTEYDAKILTEGTSVQDVLRKFNELPLVISDGF